MEKQTPQTKLQVVQPTHTPPSEVPSGSPQPPETRPRFFKEGRRRTAIATADPSITIIEVSAAVGFLLAEGCYETLMATRLHLEPVTWVRLQGEHVLHSRAFDEIVLYRHDSGLFVAQEPASAHYLFCPSIEPYVVIFISQAQYEALQGAIAQAAIEQLLESLQEVTQELPGFSFQRGTLSAPPQYARAELSRLDHEVITLDVPSAT